MKTFTRKSKILAITISTVVVLAGILTAYVIHRQQDTALYQKALNHIATLEAQSNTIDNIFKTFTIPSDITIGDVKTIEKTAKEYDLSLAGLSTNITASHDTIVKKTYNDIKEGITKYSTGVVDQAQWAGSFILTVKTCQTFVSSIKTIKTLSDFDDKATDCNDLIEALQTADKDSFVLSYGNSAADVILAYRDIIKNANDATAKKAAQTSLVAALQKNVTATETRIDFQLPDNPKSSLEKLKQVVTNRNATLFR